MARVRILLAAALASALAFGCAGGGGDDFDPGPNPFLEGRAGDEGKADTGYVNLRGVEVEVTVEADLEAPEYRIFEGPADLAQFAVTYLRNREGIFIELLAEDADAPNRVQWLVDGQWLSREEAEAAGRDQLRRFRIPGVNTVLLEDAAEGVVPGRVIEARVPVRPYATMAEGGQACADYNSHIDLSQSVYWYLYNPDRPGCELETQAMTLTVEEVLPQNPESYPEYDRLIEDGRLDVVILWGKLDDGNVEDDYNWRNVRAIADFLTDADFVEQEEAPLGRRFVRVKDGLTVTVDVYGPDLFHSVADYARMANWQRAVSEHEVVMYNGHSVLGSGMAFEQVDYPDFYQIFQVASCLSYEYYVRPVLAGKGGWDNVDVISNVDPTYYSENLPLTSTILARLIEGAENGGRTSWQDIMEAVSRRLHHSRFGVSGARDNCFSPDGNRCENPPPPDPDVVRFESQGSVAIPDNDDQGVSTSIQVTGGPMIASMAVEIDLSHTYVGDLEIVLSNGAASQTIWDREGGGDDDVRGTFQLDAFDGQPSDGTWTLQVVDHANIDVGTLNSWALVITPAP